MKKHISTLLCFFKIANVARLYCFQSLHFNHDLFLTLTLSTFGSYILTKVHLLFIQFRVSLRLEPLSAVIGQTVGYALDRSNNSL